MKDENIKEILDKLQKVANRETASRNALMEMKNKDYQLLLDYITNLEKENENRINESLSYDLAVARIKELEQENKVLLEKYSIIQILYNSSKLKNDKAIEYIKEDMYVEPKELYGLVDGEHLLNILQGSDK